MFGSGVKTGISSSIILNLRQIILKGRSKALTVCCVAVVGVAMRDFAEYRHEAIFPPIPDATATDSALHFPNKTDLEE